MLRLAFDFIITWRETRTRPNAYIYSFIIILFYLIFANYIFDIIIEDSPL